MNEQHLGRHACCTLWDSNPLVQEMSLVRAVRDQFPVTDGHSLVYPRRHVESFADLIAAEMLQVHRAIRTIRDDSDATDFTIAVNDGPAAGRTVHHAHVHVIPRRPGDVPDPRGGVRRLFGPSTDDPWILGVDAADRMIDAGRVGKHPLVNCGPLRFALPAGEQCPTCGVHAGAVPAPEDLSRIREHWPLYPAGYWTDTPITGPSVRTHGWKWQ